MKINNNYGVKLNESKGIPKYIEGSKKPEPILKWYEVICAAILLIFLADHFSF